MFAQETGEASLRDLRRLIDEQRALLEEQSGEIAALRKKLEETSVLALATRNELEARQIQLGTNFRF